jgi:hypothetical protein
MQQRLQTLVINSGSTQLVELFGYTTKGLPGLEIVGLGSEGRVLKEKIIFLARSLGAKIPKRRFVLCCDRAFQGGAKKTLEDHRWMELPLFVLYMTLAEVFPLQNLHRCFCAGTFDLSGSLTDWEYPEEFWSNHQAELMPHILLCSDRKVSRNSRVLDLRPLFPDRMVS